ncbi:putative uncharacterized protein [Corynebacterium casei UCMA 3821]|uniref:Uncharacterized protein n=1 Tax=Corynebacterium casei UCMA 3821 TaxID=1110505 RepID=G7I1S2_9CORY|nr:putative uncharacterized protein [Corynebacterium casei UCMA 3821]
MEAILPEYTVEATSWETQGLLQANSPKFERLEK